MKKLLTAVIISLMSLGFMSAQDVGTWEWARLFDTIGDVVLDSWHMDIATDASDNVYILGVFRDRNVVIGSEELVNAGRYDIFLCSFGPTGNFRWARSIGSAQTDDIAGLVVDGSDIYVGGAYKGEELFFSHSAFSLQPDNHYDSFIAHYSTDGTFQDAKRIFWGIQSQRIRDIELDDANGYLVTVGSFRNHLVYGSGIGDTLALQDYKDLFIARFDISSGFGSLAFSDVNSFMSPGDNETLFKNVNLSVIGSSLTGYFVTGDLDDYIKFNATDSLEGASASATDAMMIKLNTDLDYVWGRRGGDIEYDHTNSSISDTDGNLYVAGKYQASVTFDSTATLQSAPIPWVGFADLFLAKYNREGRLLWLEHYGESGNDDAFGLALLTDTFVQVAGNVSGTGTTNTGFLKMDLNGTFIGEGEIFGKGEDVGKAVAFDSEGNTFMAGYFDSDTLIFGSAADPDTLLENKTGTNDGFLGKYQYPLLIVREQVDGVLCKGGSTGYIKLRGEFGVPPYTWTWEGRGETVPEIDTLVAGTYIVEVTDADTPANIARDTLVISEPEFIVIDRAITDLGCFNDESGAIDITVSGGIPAYDYLWEIVSGGCNLKPTDADQTELCAGSYMITVTDGNGCALDSTFIVTEPAALAVVVDSIHDVTTGGGSDGAIYITASNGTPAYTYEWIGPSYSSSDEDPTGLAFGVYSVVVTDSESCKDSTKATVNDPDDPPLVELVVDQMISCFGVCDGQVTAVATGGSGSYSYSWDHDGGLTASVAPDLCAGWVKVTVDDGVSPTVSDSVYMNQPDILQGFKTPENVRCYDACDGSIIIDVIGGTAPYSHHWNTDEITQNLLNLCPGTYSDTVTDANGCTAVANTIITQPLQPFNFTIDEYEPLCYGDNSGSLKINASGNTPYADGTYRYLWSNGLTTDSISLIYSEDYSVRVEDSLGCVDYGYVALGQPDPVAVDIPENKPACFGLIDGALTAAGRGGTPTYTYLWTPGDLTTPRITDLNPGVYNCVVTDTNGCTGDTTVTVDESTQIVVTLEDLDTIWCEGDSACIDVSVSGGIQPYTYLWSPDGETTQDICGKTVGSYYVTVTDSIACIGISETYEVVDTSTPIDIITQSVKDVSCFGLLDGEITLRASGASPLKYSIDDGATWQDEQDTIFSDLAAGDYITVVEDSNACMKYGDTLAVDQPDTLIIASIEIDSATNDQENDGSIVLSASGGTEPYTYYLDDVVESEMISDLSPGTYDVRIEDVNGCATTDSSVEVGDLAEGIYSLFGIRDMLIFPNPSTGQFTVEIENQKGEDMAIEIINMTGQMVFKEYFKYDGAPKFIRTIDLGRQSKGTYFMRVNGYPVKAKLMID